jgi:hypothetical protein
MHAWELPVCAHTHVRYVCWIGSEWEERRLNKKLWKGNKKSQAKKIKKREGGQKVVCGQRSRLGWATRILGSFVPGGSRGECGIVFGPSNFPMRDCGWRSDLEKMRIRWLWPIWRPPLPDLWPWPLSISCITATSSLVTVYLSPHYDRYLLAF